MWKVKQITSLLLAYFIDIKRFVSNSQIYKVDKNIQTLQAHMLRLSHALEKGMSLPSPREGYGKSKLCELILCIDNYCINYEQDRIVDIAVSAVKSLLDFHESQGVDSSDIKGKLNVVMDRHNLKVSEQISGKKVIKKEYISGAIPNSPENFFFSRYSVRDFNEHPIEKDTLFRALELANKSPSVCNRQSVRIHMYHSKREVEKVLSLQDGNVGFGHTAQTVILITSDLSCFYKSGERNQGYTDGGIYTMSLVYALHSLVLGTCILNCSLSARAENKLRRELAIPGNEAIVSMVAVGNLKDEFNIAISPRRNINSLVTYNK